MFKRGECFSMNGVLIMRVTKTKFLPILAMAGLLTGCSDGPTTPVTHVDRQYLSQRCDDAVSAFKVSRPGMDKWIKSAYAYAILPSVGAGAIGIGGASGRGEVIRNGGLLGYCRLTQVNIGAQIGGQEFAELILFQNKYALSQFETGQTTFDARATAVAAASGAGTAANYQYGVVVFTLPLDGLMVQAAIGGQHFTFAPVD
jgi:lipid-binding SYLF domain-containing protein